MVQFPKHIGDEEPVQAFMLNGEIGKMPAPLACRLLYSSMNTVLLPVAALVQFSGVLATRKVPVESSNCTVSVCAPAPTEASGKCGRS